MPNRRPGLAALSARGRLPPDRPDDSAGVPDCCRTRLDGWAAGPPEHPGTIGRGHVAER